MTDTSTDLPAADPQSTLSYRSLKAVVIFLGVLIVLALVLVVFGVGRNLAGHKTGPAPEAATYALPAGSKILSLSVAGTNLVLAVQTPHGNRVYIFSTSDGHLIGQIAPAAQ